MFFLVKIDDVFLLMANFFQYYGCQILTQFTHERNSVRRLPFLLNFIFELKTRLYVLLMTQKPKNYLNLHVLST